MAPVSVSGGSTPTKDLMLKWSISRLSESKRAQQAVTHLPFSQSIVRRFVAGDALPAALEAAKGINESGMEFSLDYLGEAVGSVGEVEEATEVTLATLEGIASEGLRGNISVKPSQFGLDIDEGLCHRSLARVLASAARLGEGDGEIFVRLDMESSRYVEPTISLVEALWKEGYRNVGTVLQSCLRRTPDDLSRLNDLGARTRLVKGAYKEPRELAFPDKKDVDRAFRTQAETLLLEGAFPALATHDETLISAAREFAAARGIDKDRFEFQMLYGVRRDLAKELKDDGYRVRIYVPFGDSWYPYLMRRLAERPANVLFLLNSVISESRFGRARPRH